MISQEDNMLLCLVDGDAPMGKIMRNHWLPACMSEEIPLPDGKPVRVRLLGENLVAFRDTEGRVGVIDEYCPHRRASMALGRNEECGLRCLYHGWKVDVEGNVIEMPRTEYMKPLALYGSTWEIRKTYLNLPHLSSSQVKTPKYQLERPS
jgi:phthalate 4,5-dioxygenase oxygenase subunit